MNADELWSSIVASCEAMGARHRALQAMHDLCVWTLCQGLEVDLLWFRFGPWSEADD